MGAQRKLLNWSPRPVRVRRRPNTWQSPKGDKRTLTLVPSEHTSSWPSIEDQYETATVAAEISPGYKRAIDLLRSLRNVKPEELEEKRRSYDSLVQVMNEDRYH